MSNMVQFSDIQLLNLSFLMTLQASIRKDPVAACYQYRLNAKQAPEIADIPPEKLQSLVANLGHTLLFEPRPDIPELLKMPAGLIGALSAVCTLNQSADKLPVSAVTTIPINKQ